MWSLGRRAISSSRSTGRDGNRPAVPLIDQVGIPNRTEVRIAACRVAAVQTVREYPRHILDVRDAEDVRLLRVQVECHSSRPLAPQCLTAFAPLIFSNFGTDVK